MKEKSAAAGVLLQHLFNPGSPTWTRIMGFRNKGNTFISWSPAATPDTPRLRSPFASSDQTSLSSSSKSPPGENSLPTVSRLLSEHFPVLPTCWDQSIPVFCSAGKKKKKITQFISLMQATSGSIIKLRLVPFKCFG